MGRTVCYPERNSEFKFRHDEWQEHLVARYIAICLRVNRFQDLKERALYFSVFFAAGEILRYRPEGEFTFTNFYTNAAFVEYDKTGIDDMVIANAGVLIGYAFCNSQPDMIADFLHRTFAAMVPATIARHSTLNALGFRAVQSGSKDADGQDRVKPAVLKILEEILDHRVVGVNPLTMRLAWYFFHLLNRDKKLAHPNLGELQTLDSRTIAGFLADIDHPVHQIVSITALWKDSRWTPGTIQQQTLQIAWVKIQRDLFEALYLGPVSSALYLYAVVLAYHANVLHDRARELLQEWMADGDYIQHKLTRFRTEVAVEHDWPQPVVDSSIALYEYCIELYHAKAKA